MQARSPIHVSLVAAGADAMALPLSGLYEVLNCFEILHTFDDRAPERNPFRPEIVGPPGAGSRMETASGLSVPVHRTIDEVERTGIVFVPSMMVAHSEWIPGRYDEVVDWLLRMHGEGSTLCSACSGVLLLAETGLLNDREATIHWAYASTFRSNFPDVELRLEEILVVAGDREEFVMSGASASWHDLVLYIVAREVGPAAARAVARFMLLQWHTEGQGPYLAFEAPTDHGDAEVLRVQRWIGEHFSVDNPVTRMVERSTLPERTFKRRFKKATGHSPITYVQHLRVQEAKARLEQGDTSVEEISRAVGYGDPSFFRRLFKRITNTTPGAYRRKFRLPEFIEAGSSSRR